MSKENKPILQVSFVANVRSLNSIEHSVNTQLMALQLNPEVEIVDVSCGAFVAPVGNQAKKEGKSETNLLWLSVIQYKMPPHNKQCVKEEQVGAEYTVK